MCPDEARTRVNLEPLGALGMDSQYPDNRERRQAFYSEYNSSVV